MPHQTKKLSKLTGRTRDLASKFIAEEVKTLRYPRKQAIAIGISRARAATRKSAITKQVEAVLKRHQ